MTELRPVSKASVGTLAVLAAALLALILGGKPYVQSLKPEPDTYSGGTSAPLSPLPFEQTAVGPPPSHNARITNVQIVDFDKDGRQDVLACDVQRNGVFLYRATEDGSWAETVIADDFNAPAHATVVDLDQDGRSEIIVSILGDLYGVDEVVGRVIWLKPNGDGFEQHVLLDDVRRVADVQAGDLDGDGDIDLAVASFGYTRGQVLWLENVGDGQFRDHELLAAAGTIHVPLADYDGDGDLDIAAIVSQEDEELWAFENLGGGKFRSRRLWFTVNFDVGSAGLVQDDLDGDGDPDLLLPLGDNLEYQYAYPQPYHGCLWFENLGGWNFKPHRIANFGGAYAAAVGDLDGDGDRDVVLVSLVNDWQKSGHASVVWLENDGQQNFKMWEIARQPTHLTTVACGDLNGDGRDDIVAGVMKVLIPYEDREGRLPAWMSQRTTP